MIDLKKSIWNIIAFAALALALNACEGTNAPDAQMGQAKRMTTQPAAETPTGEPSVRGESGVHRSGPTVPPATPLPSAPLASPTAPTSNAEVPLIKPQIAKIDKSLFPQAPPLSSNLWLNSQPLKPEDLRGKVVVVDFWTFACYNCKNVLPYLKTWDEKYRAQGLVIIGVHTPELSFERDIENVKQAVKDYGIKYPVAIDGDYANWNRYKVWAWPTWFILDKEGYIRYSHIGEGDYAKSEATIQQLLAE